VRVVARSFVGWLLDIETRRTKEAIVRKGIISRPSIAVFAGRVLGLGISSGIGVSYLVFHLLAGYLPRKIRRTKEAIVRRGSHP